MFNTQGLMSSDRMDWKTPKALYSALDSIFHFDFDPCPVNPTFDGLKVDWGGGEWQKLCEPSVWNRNQALDKEIL